MSWMLRRLERVLVAVSVGAVVLLLVPAVSSAGGRVSSLPVGKDAKIVSPTGPPPVFKHLGEGPRPSMSVLAPHEMKFGTPSGPLVSRYSSATSDTYRLPSGQFETKVFSRPVNYKNSKGDWEPIKNSWTTDPAAGGGAVQNSGNSWHVRLPGHLNNGDVSIADGGHSFGFSVAGAADAPVTISGAHATYKNAFQDASVEYQVEPELVREKIVISSPAAPDSYTFALQVPAGYTPRLVHGQVEFFDQSGHRSPVSIATPTVTDSATGSKAGLFGPLAVRLEQTASGWQLVETVDRGWLESKDRVFPATIDPTVTMDGAQTDCILTTISATTSYCNSPYLLAGSAGGYTSRAIMNFGSMGIPMGAQVDGAALSAWFAAGTATSFYAYPVRSAWNSNATWNSNGTSNWPVAGGDVANPPADTEAVPASAGWVSWAVTQQVQNWLNGTAQNYGFMIGNDLAANRTLGSYAGGIPPQLQVIWSFRSGQPQAAPMVSIPEDDGIGLSVNASTGGAELSLPGFDIKGTGVDLNLAAHYSTTAGTDPTQGDFAGPDMDFLPGPAMGLTISTTGGGWNRAAAVLVVKGPDGQAHPFVYLTGNAYFSAGYPAVLYYITAADGLDYWVLQMDDSGEQYVFDANADDLYGRMIYDQDRNGDGIIYGWANNNGQPYLAQIADTQGRTMTPTYALENGAQVVTAWKDSAGARTMSFSENSAGEVATVTPPGSGAIQLGYNSVGLLSSITDPRGEQTTIGYDSSGRVTSVLRVAGTGTNPTYGFSYSTPGSVCGNAPTIDSSDSSAVFYPVIGESTYTDPDGHSTTFCYDGQDRVPVEQDAVGDVVTNIYNYVDQVLNSALTAPDGTKVSNAAVSYDSVGGAASDAPTSGTVTGGSTPSASSTQAGGTATYPGSFANGNEFLPSAVTDPLGNKTSYSYDANGNLTQVVDPLPGGNNTINLTYGVSGHPGLISQSTTPMGAATTYQYYTNGNLQSIKPPSPRGTESFTYDALSRVLTDTDADGNVTTNTYNPDDQLTSTAYSGGETDSYNYDADGNLTSEVVGNTLQSNTYNGLGQLTKTVLSTGQTVSYGYDLAGNLTSFADGAGTYGYQYNQLNQLTDVIEPNGKDTAFKYDAQGERTEIDYPNGVVVKYTWSAGQLAEITATDSAGTKLADLVYQYNPKAGSTTQYSSQLKEVDDAVTKYDTSYVYDALSRLVTATTVQGSTTEALEAYAYDGDGNMTYAQSGGSAGGFTYNTADEQVTEDGQGEVYDPDGNLVSALGYTNSYNAEDQPTSMFGLPYGFFGSGENDQTQEWGYTFQNTQLGLTAISNGGATNYITADSNGTPIGEISSAGDYYFIANPVTGSVLYTTNSSGAVARTNSYDPYGNLATSTGSGPDDIGWDGGFNLPGWSLEHFGARQYWQSIGRWTQPDPAAPSLVSDPTQADPYTFAADDPINKVDPTGKLCAEAWRPGYMITDGCEVGSGDPSEPVGDNPEGDGHGGLRTRANRLVNKHATVHTIRKTLDGMAEKHPHLSPSWPGLIGHIAHWISNLH